MEFMDDFTVHAFIGMKWMPPSAQVGFPHHPLQKKCTTSIQLYKHTSTKLHRCMHIYQFIQ